MKYKSILLKFIPKSWEPRLRLGFYFIRGLWFSGRRMYCPCCNTWSRRFLPGGTEARPNAQCPRCGSLERHRLLWLYLQQKTDFFTRPQRVLDVSPSYFQQQRLNNYPHLDYTSTDLQQAWVMIHSDLANMPFPDNHFDCILCYHVLEHIADDRQAMKELYRILKPERWAILQSPVDQNRTSTLEDPGMTSPEARRLLFGQEDHLRVYGRDYTARLEEAGFHVFVDTFVRSLSLETVKKYGLIGDESIYVGIKRLHD